MVRVATRHCGSALIFAFRFAGCSVLIEGLPVLILLLAHGCYLFGLGPATTQLMPPHVGSRKLARRAYATSTLRKYDAAVWEFIQWARDSGIAIYGVQELDEYLCDYVEYLFDDGESRGHYLRYSCIFSWMETCIPHGLTISAGVEQDGADEFASTSYMGPQSFDSD